MSASTSGALERPRLTVNQLNLLPVKLANQFQGRMFWATPPEKGPVPPDADGGAAGWLSASGASIMAMCGLLKALPAAKFAAIKGWVQEQGHPSRRRCAAPQDEGCALPAPLPPVPGEQQICEAIIGEARDRQHRRIAEQRCQPAFAGRDPPDRNRDIGADDQAAGFVRCMQPAADGVERGAIRCQRLRLFIDVAERKLPGAHRGEQLVALPVDPGVANGTARVVPDDEAMLGHRSPALPHQTKPSSWALALLGEPRRM